MEYGNFILSLKFNFFGFFFEGRDHFFNASLFGRSICFSIDASCVKKNDEREREGRSYKGERDTRRGEVLGKDRGIQNIGSPTMRQRHCVSGKCVSGQSVSIDIK